MEKVFKQVDNPNDKAMSNRLAALGITIDKDGQFVGNPFQGSPDPATGPDNIGPDEAAVESVDPFGKIDDENLEVPPSPDETAPEPPETSDDYPDSEHKLKGLEKREADARAAQAAMSKTEARLKLMESSLNQRIAELDEDIKRLASLHATVGPVPSDLNPADAATLANWREEQPEAIAVMEAIVAPIYTVVAQLREQTNGVVQKMGEYFAAQRMAKVNEGIYSKIPEHKIKKITESPEFIDWLSHKPASKKNLYVNILTKTSNYTPEEALEIFQEYSKDMGIDVGLNGAAPKPRPTMDRAPALRSGGALPENPRREQNRNALTLLSPDEMANIGRLLSEGSVEQRDHNRKRLELTLPNTDLSAWANA